MNSEYEIQRLRALIDYAATSLESFGIMLAAAEQLRQPPLPALIDPILHGAQEAANTLWKALAENIEPIEKRTLN